MPPETRPSRELAPDELSAIKEMYLRKAQHQPPCGYVTAAEPLRIGHWNGKRPVEENTTYRTIPAGTTLKIVMVSRLNDCGLSDDLNADYGYGLRLQWDDAGMTNIRLTP